jgi:hypothetical protein
MDCKSLAFCAMQGELHATNAGAGMCRLDRSEARCRSVAAKAQKVRPQHCAAQSMLRASPGCPSLVTRRTHALDPWTDSQRPGKQMRSTTNGKTGKRWTKIGAAFPYKEGIGFSIELKAFPLDGRLVALPPDTDDGDNRRNGK